MYLPPRPDLDTSLDPEPPGSFQPHHSSSPSPSATSISTSRYRSAAQAQRTKGSRSRYQERYQQRGVARNARLTRDDLREFADMTLEALEAGAYFPPHAEEPFDLRAKITYTEERTAYYSPDDREIAAWAQADFGFGFGFGDGGDGDGPDGEGKAKAEGRCETKIVMKEISTLAGARELHKMLQAHPEVQNRTIGVLNFASAKKPGGGFMNGAQAQEESIARSSTLYPSLITPIATQFYAHYAQDPDNPYYTHAMVYSPAVTLFRNDKGHFKTPVDVDVLTSAAVNAGEVRQKIMWEEDMRVLRARVRAAEALRERQVQERRERERVFREQRERARAERMKRFAEKDRLKAEEAKRKKEEEERKKAGEEANVNNEDNMEVDEENKAADVEMKEPDAPKTETQAEAQKSTHHIQELQQDGSSAWTSILLDDSPLVKVPLQQDESNPWILVASKNTSKPSPPNPADIPLPTTPPIPDLPRMPSPPTSPPSPPRIPLPTLLALADADIITEMRERIARLLYLFHLRGAGHLVLGAYGTGVFQNDVSVVAGIFYDLLVAPGAKFEGVFESVVFAILGGPTIRDFRKVFGDGVVNDEEGGADSEEEGEVVEEVQDGKADDGKDDEGKIDNEMADDAKVKDDEAHAKEEPKKDAKETRKLIKKPQPSGARQSTLFSYFGEKKAGPSTSTKMLGKRTDKPEPETADLAKAKAKVEPELKTSESEPTTEPSTTSLPEKAKVEKKVYPRPPKALTTRKVKVDPEPQPKASTSQPSTEPSPANPPASTKEDKKHFPPAAPI